MATKKKSKLTPNFVDKFDLTLDQCIEQAETNSKAMAAKPIAELIAEYEKEATKDGLPNNKELIKNAKENGFAIWRGDAWELLLDLDTADAVEQYERMLPMVNKYYPQTFKVANQWPSKNGGLHVVLHEANWQDITNRAALQAILGSDPKCELFRLIRQEKGQTDENILLMPHSEELKATALHKTTLKWKDRKKKNEQVSVPKS